MAKIAIIGGGIIGMTAAFYLSNTTHDITLFDESTGQATKASAGIICPWLSKRRNKKWYALAKDGAAFYKKLVDDLQLDDSIYQKSGALILRPEKNLVELANLAKSRKIDAPEIGDIELLSGSQTKQRIPILKKQPSLFISGGAKLNGEAYLMHVAEICKQNQVKIHSKHVSLKKSDHIWTIYTDDFAENFDTVICASGPHLKKLLAPLGLEVDIRPQKGQLLSFQTTDQASSNWPVVMLDGEADFIPFQNGELLLGATHENEAGWDLKKTSLAFDSLTNDTDRFFDDKQLFKSLPYETKVGTRAYTSDFAPFFGPVDNYPNLLVASGLGSSGLTTGPYIGYLLANFLLTSKWPTKTYQNPMNTYIKSTKILN